MTRICLILIFVALSSRANAAGDEKERPKHRPLSLYLTHGYSHIHNHQLTRLSVGEDSLVIGAGAGFHLPSGVGIDAEFTSLNSMDKDSTDYGSRYISQATTSYQQERLTLGGSFRYFLGRNFALFPEGGVSYNRIQVGISEFSYSLKEKANALGWYLGIGAIVPIKRVFFDFRLKYNVVDLKMGELGIDSPMYQTTVLIGFGFVI